MNNTQQALICLARCAIHQKKPENLEIPDFQALYDLAVFHSIPAMIAMALESGGYLTADYMSEEQIFAWKDCKNKAIRKNLVLDAERSTIISHFEKNGVWYLPLKGSVLKDLYPKMGMRQMADNDVLFDASYRDRLRDYMLSLGYAAVDSGAQYHDEYEKPPVYSFEFHTSLYGPVDEPALSDYYRNVKDRLIKDSGNGFGYHFTDEDFYVYITSHTYKHYIRQGTGIRSLLDSFVYVSKKGDSLDWDYIRRESEKLGIAEFEQQSRTLAMKIFAPEPQALTAKEAQMLELFLSCGTYGTDAGDIQRQLVELQGDGKPITLWTKIRFWLRHLFPGLEYMRKYVPFCYRHRWCIPFYWIYRLFWALFHRRDTIRKKFKIVKDS